MKQVADVRATGHDLVGSPWLPVERTSLLESKLWPTSNRSRRLSYVLGTHHPRLLTCACEEFKISDQHALDDFLNSLVE